MRECSLLPHPSRICDRLRSFLIAPFFIPNGTACHSSSTFPTRKPHDLPWNTHENRPGSLSVELDIGSVTKVVHHLLLKCIPWKVLRSVFGERIDIERFGKLRQIHFPLSRRLSELFQHPWSEVTQGRFVAASPT